VARDIRGKRPGARWGHSLTSIEDLLAEQTNRQGVRKLAVLLGGRNERCNLNDMHMLSLVTPDGSNDASSHLLWETICFQADMAVSLPFHHATVAVPDDTDSTELAVFVFGGLLDPCELLPRPSRNGANLHVLCFRVAVDPPNHYKAISSDVDIPVSFDFAGIGCAVTCLTNFSASLIGVNRKSHRHVVLVSGGTPEGVYGGDDQLQRSSLLRLTELSKGDNREAWLVRHLPWAYESLDEPFMVHHRALVLSVGPNETEMMVVGGGVMGFAFGPCFAR
jgi:hypothetical protein